MKQDLEFHGVLNLDDAGAKTGSMLYPAPSAGGFLAAVITHGLLIDSTKNEQKRKLLESADKVLEPHRAMIDALRMPRLLEAAAALAASADRTGQAPILSVAPVFLLTQDERALIVELSAWAGPVESIGKTAPKAVVRVVSQARPGEDRAAYWGADSSGLGQEAVRLLAHAIELASPAVQDAGRDVAFRTLRYREGGAEKMERAQVVAKPCGRLVMRTLREALLSVPRAEPDDPGCAAALAGWR